MKKIGVHHFFMAALGVWMLNLVIGLWMIALGHLPSFVLLAAAATLAFVIIGVGAILAALGKIEP